MVLLALAASMSAGAACHPLLMEPECIEHGERFAKAASAEQRAALERRLAELLRERARLCPQQTRDKDGSGRPSGLPRRTVHKNAM
jgi:hypothetical protein